MKKILFFLLLLPSLMYSQYSICGLIETEENFIACLEESPSLNILNNSIIKNISDKVGISPNFTFKYCANTKNAAAVINPLHNNSRYILFDSDYFNALYNRDKYSVLFVIAHEIGHHLNGHTLGMNYESISDLHRQELEADYFAGFIMFKLGASERDIIETIKKIPEPKSDYSTHPKNYQRVNYALKGYLNEANKYKTELYQIRESLSNEINRKADLEQLNELINALNEYSITGEEKKLDIAEYILNRIDDKALLTDQLMAYIDYKKGRYDLALDFYKKQYLRTKRSDHLIDFLKILSNTDKSSYEISSIINNLENTSNDPELLLNLGIYYKKIGKHNKGLAVGKKAYDLIKDKEDSVLKSDILLLYGRSLYDNQLAEKDRNMSFPKMLLTKSKKIIESYPNDEYYRKYYNTILFHLGNIQTMDKDFDGAIFTFNQLLSNKIERKDYIFKVNASLGNIYSASKNYSEAIQYYTTAIINCDNSKYKRDYFYLRGRTYVLNHNTELGMADIERSCDMGQARACSQLEEIKKMLEK